MCGAPIWSAIACCRPRLRAARPGRPAGSRPCTPLLARRIQGADHRRPPRRRSTSRRRRPAAASPRDPGPRGRTAPMSRSGRGAPDRDRHRPAQWPRGQSDAPGPGHVGDEVLGQQRQEPGARGWIGVDDLKGGLDDRDLRRGGRAKPQESAVGSQGSLRHDRGRTATAGQRRRFGQGRKGAGIVGLLLRVAKPDEEISVFVIGNIEGGTVVQRRAVPPGAPRPGTAAWPRNHRPSSPSAGPRRASRPGCSGALSGPRGGS